MGVFADASRVCVVCETPKARGAYSKGQLKKRDSVTNEFQGRCKECAHAQAGTIVAAATVIPADHSAIGHAAAPPSDVTRLIFSTNVDTSKCMWCKTDHMQKLSNDRHNRNNRIQVRDYTVEETLALARQILNKFLFSTVKRGKYVFKPRSCHNGVGLCSMHSDLKRQIKHVAEQVST